MANVRLAGDNAGFSPRCASVFVAARRARTRSAARVPKSRGLLSLSLSPSRSLSLSLSLSLALSLAPVVARVRGIAKGACPLFFRVLKLAATAALARLLPVPRVAANFRCFRNAFDVPLSQTRLPSLRRVVDGFGSLVRRPSDATNARLRAVERAAK